MGDFTRTTDLRRTHISRRDHFDRRRNVSGADVGIRCAGGGGVTRVHAARLQLYQGVCS